MSSISGASGVAAALYQFFSPLPGTQAVGGSSPVATPDGSTTTTGQTSPVQGHHHGGGGGGGGVGQLFKRIEAAVSTALQSASDSDGDSENPTNINTAIQNAIANVLQGNTVTGTVSPNRQGSPSTAGASATESAESPDSSQQKFFQLLQANGVDPEQFQSDLQTAFQDAAGGNVNMATVFRSFPRGSVIDTLA